MLKEAKAGVPVKDLCRRIGVSEATFYHWKAKYRGLEVNETRRLRQLEEENGRLKKIVVIGTGTDGLVFWHRRRLSLPDGQTTWAGERCYFFASSPLK